MESTQLAAGLLSAGAVKLRPHEPFTWSSGLKAPIYCDNRQLLGDPALRSQIADALADVAKEIHPTLIAGTSTAGIPWGALVAERLKRPFAYVRPEPKKHGMGRQVEGLNATGHRVVLIEDLISTGGSSLKCVQALRLEGAEVACVLALFSYGFSEAQAAFDDAQVPLRVLGTFDALRLAAREQGLIGDSGSESLATWQSDHATWSKHHGGV
jgi:orotate phosphoribosyltransferase